MAFIGFSFAGSRRGGKVSTVPEVQAESRMNVAKSGISTAASLIDIVAPVVKADKLVDIRQGLGEACNKSA